MNYSPKIITFLSVLINLSSQLPLIHDNDTTDFTVEKKRVTHFRAFWISLALINVQNCRLSICLRDASYRAQAMEQAAVTNNWCLVHMARQLCWLLSPFNNLNDVPIIVMTSKIILGDTPALCGGLVGFEGHLDCSNLLSGYSTCYIVLAQNPSECCVPPGQMGTHVECDM